jgi:hypothetical protein
LFILKEDALAALQNLDCILHLAQKDISEIKFALRVVFDSLYFPELISEAYKLAIKAYPVLQFLIYRFLTLAGIYSPLELIPPHLAKMQHCIRLQALHRMILKFKKHLLKERVTSFDLYETFYLFIPKVL